ncbi:MAG TPA: DNA-binding domain-containing protein [Polyangiaceae bacterium]
MKRQTTEIDALHERASATPETKGSHRSIGRRVSTSVALAGVAEEDASLRSRQLRFANAVTTPESLPAPFAQDSAAKWFTAGPRMTALERIEVYRRAYHARLVECLADDYRTVQHALGESGFEDLCRGYIASFPSTGPNLNHFGRRMSTFVRDGAPESFPLRAFVADLATLEWAIVEVIHAASEPPLTPEGLRDVPQDAWGDLRLEATPAFRLLRFDYPVNAYFQAFRDDESPVVPAASPSATVVYRSGAMVWRMDLTPPMTEVLAALVAGEPLGEALGRAEAGLSHLDEAAMGALVTTWFREWVGHGLFVRADWSRVAARSGG